MFVCMLDDDEDARSRDKLAYERHKERERERRIARANPEKRSSELLVEGRVS